MPAPESSEQPAPAPETPPAQTASGATTLGQPPAAPDAAANAASATDASPAAAAAATTAAAPLRGTSPRRPPPWERLKHADKHWAWKAGIRLLLWVADAVGIGCTAWLIANTINTRHYEMVAGVASAVLALKFFAVSFAWATVALLYPLLSSYSRPLPPLAVIAVDFVLYAVPAVFIAFAAAAVRTLQDFGTRPRYPQDATFIADLDQKPTRLALHIVFLAMLCVATACHFAVWVWACVSYLRRQRRLDRADNLALDIVDHTGHSSRYGAAHGYHLAPAQAYYQPAGPVFVPMQPAGYAPMPMQPSSGSPEKQASDSYPMAAYVMPVAQPPGLAPVAMPAPAQAPVYGQQPTVRYA